MKRTWKTLICLFAALVMLFGVACSKSELPKESASLRESVEDTDDAYGNAYRAYTMGKQVLADFYLDNEEGGRGYNYYDKSRTADSWNYVSLLNMVRYMLELYPEDEELLSLYKNAILGMEYFGSIAKGGTKSPALRRWPLPPWRKTKWRAVSWKPRRRNFAPSSAPRRGI